MTAYRQTFQRAVLPLLAARCRLGSMTEDSSLRTGPDPDRSSSFPDTGHYPEVKRTFA